MKAASEAQNPSLETTHFDQKQEDLTLASEKGLAFEQPGTCREAKESREQCFCCVGVVMNLSGY